MKKKNALIFKNNKTFVINDQCLAHRPDFLRNRLFVAPKYEKIDDSIARSNGFNLTFGSDARSLYPHGCRANCTV